MERGSFFSCTQLRQLAARAFVGALLCGAAVAAQAATDGLAIAGSTQMAAIVGRPYTFTPRVTNPSGRALTFGIVNKPAWATLNTKTGQLSGTPSNVVTTYLNISISVTDGVSTVRTPAFYIKVYAAGASDRPTITGTPATSVAAGSPYGFQPTARDWAGQPLSFSVKNKPAWASFSIATGRLSGTPTSAQAGTYGSVQISVSNGQLTAALPAFSIQVKGATATASNPTVSLGATPASISKGATAMLSWSATNATSCTASGGWSGSKALSGSLSTGALSSTSTYTLTCSGASGTTAAVKSTTVTVAATASGGVARPPYNTGHGLFVLNGKLYDSRGIEFRIRGVNLCHYDSTPRSGPGIARSNANAVRIALWLSSVPTSSYASAVQTYISDKEVAIPTMFEVPGTTTRLSGDESTTDLAAAVSNWVANFPYYSAMQQHLIINIANEWGPRASATWASAYETAIARLRAAGYTAPIMIDSGNSGQDPTDLLNYAKQVFDSDPQKNVIFSFHVYYGVWPGWTAATLDSFALQLQSLSASSGMAFVFGEFGPGRDIGPSPTMLTPQQVIGAAEAAGIGWMGWAWDDNNLASGASDNSWFSMTLNGPGMYTVASDLTTYGQQVVLSSYGLVRAQKATDF